VFTKHLTVIQRSGQINYYLGLRSHLIFYLKMKTDKDVQIEKMFWEDREIKKLNIIEDEIKNERREK